LLIKYSREICVNGAIRFYVQVRESTSPFSKDYVVFHDGYLALVSDEIPIFSHFEFDLRCINIKVGSPLSPGPSPEVYVSSGVTLFQAKKQYNLFQSRNTETKSEKRDKWGTRRKYS
jgi:hypothetical protein